MVRPSKTSERARAENILGAFALALVDKMSGAIHATGNRSDMTSAALVQIAFEPGLSIERLRNCLGLSHSATVRLIDAAQADDLVKRERGASGDSRVAALSLTAKGRTQAQTVLSARAGILSPVLNRLSATEVDQLVAILGKAFPGVVEPGADQDVVCRWCDVNACPQDRCPVVCDPA